MSNRIPDDEIIKAFGNWAVTQDGLEFLPYSYFIHKDRLDETDWEAHMEDKISIFQVGFTEALDFARHHHSNVIDETDDVN